jgi:hypothetical protein
VNTNKKRGHEFIFKCSFKMAIAFCRPSAGTTLHSTLSKPEAMFVNPSLLFSSVGWRVTL